MGGIAHECVGHICKTYDNVEKTGTIRSLKLVACEAGERKPRRSSPAGAGSWLIGVDYP